VPVLLMAGFLAVSALPDRLADPPVRQLTFGFPADMSTLEGTREEAVAQPDAR